MALTKVDIARLKSTLVQSKIQSSNPALYQVILHLMNDTIQLQDRLATVLNEIAAATTGTTTITTIAGPIGMIGLDSSDDNECFCMPFIGNILS